MEVFMESLQNEWHNIVRLLPKLVIGLIILTIFILIGRITSRTFMHIVSKGSFRPTHRIFFKNLIIWVFALIGIILGLNVIGLKSLAASLVAGGGITAVALGFAFRGIGENFLAGFFLAFSRPFEVGDLIQSKELTGIVRGIELRSTHIRSADGRDIFIPSAQIFNEPITNYTKDGLRRLSFKVGIDYGDDSEKARCVLEEAVGKVENVLTEPESGVNFSELLAAYVELDVFFWVDTFKKGIDMRSIRNDVIESSRRALINNGFVISSNVTNNIALGNFEPVSLRVEEMKAGA